MKVQKACAAHLGLCLMHVAISSFGALRETFFIFGTGLSLGAGHVPCLAIFGITMYYMCAFYQPISAHTR